MWFKQIFSVFMVMVCLCTSLCITTYAKGFDAYISDEIVPTYEIAQKLSSTLSISGTKATSESRADGDDCISITVTHNLQKYSGILWIWNDVDGTSWTETVDQNTISVSNTKSGLSSGTYRLKSVFTLTSSSGKTETITVYSEEKTIP